MDERGFLRTALTMGQIKTWSRQIEAKHALFLFDSCFSGTIFKTKSIPKPSPYIDMSVAKPMRQYITAGSAGETVPAKSAFTPMFVTAVKEGKADYNEDGYVTGRELGLFIMSTLPNMQAGLNLIQTPQSGIGPDYDLSEGDFVFVSSSTRAGRKDSARENKLPDLPDDMSHVPSAAALEKLGKSLDGIANKFNKPRTGE